jgi:hypothetical protein
MFGNPGRRWKIKASKIFLFATDSRLALWNNQPPGQRVSRNFSSVVKRLETAAKHSPYLLPAGEQDWRYTSTHLCGISGVVLVCLIN